MNNEVVYLYYHFLATHKVFENFYCNCVWSGRITTKINETIVDAVIRKLHENRLER